MKRAYAIAALLFCIAAVFWRLDGVPLWRDEATTAVWGRLMAETGSPLPYAYDRRAGQLLVQDDDGHDVNSRLLPAMQSYLQFYVSAAGHALLGSGTLQSRLPFALIGLATLGLLHWLGRLLGGPAWLPWALPLSASASIYFLHAARQGRYYILVVFAAVLLLVQVARYLRRPALGTRWSFHAQLCLIGCLLYGANYLSFAATWFALGLFFLITDRPVLLRLCCASAALAVVLGVEFWMLHAEFLTHWRPGGDATFWENLRSVVPRRGADYWRWVPFVALAPAVALLAKPSWRKDERMRSALLWAAAAVPLAGFLLDQRWLRRGGDLTFVLFCLAFLLVPVAAMLAWARIQRPGTHARMALLAGLVVVVCPLVTILLAGRATHPRYYYQTCPAAVVLIGLAAAALDAQGRRRAAVLCFAGATLWPNLDAASGGTDQVVPRQLLRHDAYNGPFLEFLSAHTRPGDTIAYVRNVKGMVGHYYLPDRRWVNLLDSELEYNRRFRGKVPDDQFDDADGPDWFVLWDARDRTPNGLDERYERVWQYDYREMGGVWGRSAAPKELRYEVYRLRRGGSGAGPDA